MGCFSIVGGAMSHLGLLPVPPHEIGLRLFLYTRSNPTRPQELAWDDESSIRSSHIRPELPTKVIVHGWREHGQRDWMIRMKDAILAKVRPPLSRDESVDFPLRNLSNFEAAPSEANAFSRRKKEF